MKVKSSGEIGSLDLTQREWITKLYNSETKEWNIENHCVDVIGFSWRRQWTTCNGKVLGGCYFNRLTGKTVTTRDQIWNLNSK